ncbi:uncharacterized protein LOC110461032 [Mizuhopecten yessoensis]|uniref:Transmembrane protein 79 n=1 Tax=Mizuhopecten yessoensis TaxID=6573 RepID=A0A210Q119_MIZYE|nr:uncharacterized protein LOC110461032 [Mizuhopecten yessoensis]OWF42454.1 Transmembrane protein 79 [Mizuhopecten yessoensis]
MKSYPDDRRYVRNNIIASVIVCVALCLLGFMLLPAPTPRLETVSMRIIYCLRWQIWPVLTLTAGISTVAHMRFFTSAIDPIEGRGEHLLEVHKRYIQNTMEQLTLHILSSILLSSFLSPESMTIIPIRVFLFVLGRVTFWYGYMKSPVKRAFGFQMTFGPSVASLLYCAFCFCNSGPAFGLHET